MPVLRGQLRDANVVRRQQLHQDGVFQFTRICCHLGRLVMPRGALAAPRALQPPALSQSFEQTHSLRYDA